MPTTRPASKIMHVAAPPWLAAALATLAGWRQRHRQRRALATLDPHLLRDVGVSAEDAARESRKPFWR